MPVAPGVVRRACATGTGVAGPEHRHPAGVHICGDGARSRRTRPRPRRPPEATGAGPAPSRFRSPEDGWLDISQFLDTRYGFLPVGQVITEPAVGFGGAGGLAFIKQSPGSMRPNITVVGGLGTENGTTGAIAADLRYWLDDRLQTLAGVLFASVNLDFYGIGDDGVVAENPRYELEPAGGGGRSEDPSWSIARLGRREVRLRADGRSLRCAGGHAGTAGDDALVGRGGDHTERNHRLARQPVHAHSRHLRGGRGRRVQPDARRRRFVPASRLIAMQFVPLGTRFFSGVRGEAAAALGDAPFYLKPFIYQRGVPAMRYLGEEMAQIETELRWQFWKRFSVVGFGGAGRTWASSEEVLSDKLAAGGAGFRYELARKHGLHVGVDIAGGPAGGVFYFQFGSAWAKP